MLKGVLETAGTWKTITESLVALVKEIYFSASDTGLYASAIDEAHIAMVSLSFPKTAFKDYHSNGNTKFGINLVEMVQIMRRADFSDSLELIVDDTKNKVKIKLTSANATRNFSLSLLGDSSEEQIPEPKIDFNTTAVINAGVLKDVIKDAEVVGDYISLDASADALKVLSEGDTGKVEVTIDKDAEGLNSYKVKEPSKAIYALKYLSDMTKALGQTDYLQIDYATDMPLKLEFETSKGVKLTFFLAPRIEGGE